MNNRFWLILFLIPSSCLGFFDDFTGSSLAPYWKLYTESPGGLIRYTVHDGLLDVEKVSGPAGALFYLYTDQIAGYGVYTDFDLRARVGWDPGEDQDLYMRVGHHEGPLGFDRHGLSYFRSPGLDPVIVASTSTGSTRIASPTSGFHDIRLRRVGFTQQVYFDGVLLREGQVQPQLYVEMDHVLFMFGGPNDAQGGQFNDLYVDWVAVTVPEPSIVLLTCLVAVGIRRKQ